MVRNTENLTQQKDYIMLNLLLIPFMAIAGRLHGWGGFKGCRPLSQVMLAIPFALAVFLSTHVGWQSTITLILTYAAVTTGTADGFNNTVRDNATVSNIAVILSKPLGIERNSEAYDNIFWAVKGILISLPAAMFLPLSIPFILISLLAFPVAYSIGYHFTGRWYTQVGETLSGAILGLALMMVL